jgi:hypothetical protein
MPAALSSGTALRGIGFHGFDVGEITKEPEIELQESSVKFGTVRAPATTSLAVPLNGIRNPLFTRAFLDYLDRVPLGRVK